MFDRFTDRARKVIVLAQEEARLLGHSYIGTEHLLLGILHEGEGMAAKTLNSMSITLEEVRDRVVKIMGSSNNTKNDKKTDENEQEKTHIPFTPKAKKVLELALKKAITVRATYIGTEHLLLGILDEPDGIAQQVLQALKTTPEEIAKNLLSQMGIADQAINPHGGGIDEIDGVGLDPETGLPLEGFEQEHGYHLDVEKAQGDDSPFPQGSSRKNPRTAKPKKDSALEHFAQNLTQKAKDGLLDPVVGRDDVINRVMQVLSRRKKNNPVLLGDPGVGKTAILEGIAQRIVNNDVPGILAHKQIYTIDITAILAGTHYRGDFEIRMKAIINEAKERNDLILFFDEIHMMVGAGGAEGSSMDAGNILKPMLSSGEIRIIGATTYDEYRKYFEKDSALERRFQAIQVTEPTPEYTVEILKGLRKKYETYHNVKIEDSALEAATKLSARYISDRYLPDKAIDLIDEAGARLRVENLTAPPNMKDVLEELKKVKKEKDNAIRGQDFELAATKRDLESQLKTKYEEMDKKWKVGNTDEVQVVDADLIAKLVSEQTGVPVYKMTQAESARLMRMEEELHKQVVGQDEAISVLSRAIRRARSGLKDPKRPSGSFIFAGPTGVGKTELVKALTSFLFDSEDSLIRLDMSEYSTIGDASKLLGSAPGFVGYEEGGQLTEKVRRNPFSVVLLDEIEKAHPQIFNTLLQVLDDGRMTDSHGRTVDFKNTIIVMTTNLGSQEITKENQLGFQNSSDSQSNYLQMKARVMEALKKDFRPEFLNRLDDVIVFKQLTHEELLQIVDLLIARLQVRLDQKDIKIELSNSAKELLAKIGFEPSLGARPLKRAIQKEIEDPLAEKILLEDVKAKSVVKIDKAKQQDKVVTKDPLALSDLYSSEKLFNFTLKKASLNTKK